jgi:hypothetical protein
LVPGAGARLTQTPLALRGGVQVAEHDVPGPATLQVWAAGCGWCQARSAGGWVRATTCRSRRSAPVERLEDAAVLLTVAAT